ncbi:MAG: TIGR03857 family LLM class F420-dependent oxidoreductase [Gammaproteobacteria bacterium]|nr:TIGR03857 family LLM class F420-dependent oxidoreductase [Gammaproteobacteria bacterium]|tara:strand:- start:120 stop:1217 length:1098 start_codon:yes stop_codon:yes gene_type:complete
MMNELAFYALAGAPENPRNLLDEVIQAEELGIGNCFLSERFNIKEAATLSGAVGAVSEKLGIATAATNHNTRHPVVTGSYASTMHFLTGGRFALGLGRGIDVLFRAMGLSRITTKQLEEFVGIMRRLHRGETISGYEGSVGKWPMLRLDPGFDEYIPLILTAFGPNSLALGGRVFDAVVLHTFFTDETTARCVNDVKVAAEKAGRNPADVRVWSCLAVVGNHLSPELQLKKTVGRMATYLQAYGDLMVRTNNWEFKELDNFRKSEIVRHFQGAIDQMASFDELQQIEELIPEDWLSHSAMGSPRNCVEVINKQFDLGCDGVILHGASPDELGPVIREYKKHRPRNRFEHLPNNPGLPPSMIKVSG